MANRVHPTAIVEGDVEMGENNVIGPYSVLYGPLTLGDDNEISPHVTIGTPGEDTRNRHYDSTESPIYIGSRNMIREHTSIQKPCYRTETRIHNDVFLMHGAHVAHDLVLEDGVVVTPFCVLGGIVTLMRYATIGMGATVHQYGIIGPYSMTATGSAATKNVKPFARYIPGRPISVNEYAIEKYGFQSVASQIREYVLEGVTPIDSELTALIARYEELHAKSGRDQYV